MDSIAPLVKNDKTSQIKGRNWNIVLNDSTLTEESAQQWLHTAFLEISNIAYICGQVEKAPTTGQLHIQGFMHFSKQIRLSAIKSHDNRLHIDLVKVNNGAEQYAMKEDTREHGPWEYGVRPTQGTTKKIDIDWKTIRT